MSLFLGNLGATELFLLMIIFGGFILVLFVIIKLLQNQSKK